jgi:tRNA(Ser,Leu) C12 N-acetylase TAN1
MKYVVEMDLIPLHITRREYPTTRRFLIEADSILEALEKIARDEVPGQDCVAVRVLELSE